MTLKRTTGRYEKSTVTGEEIEGERGRLPFYLRALRSGVMRSGFVVLNDGEGVETDCRLLRDAELFFQEGQSSIRIKEAKEANGWRVVSPEQIAAIWGPRESPDSKLIHKDINEPQMSHRHHLPAITAQGEVLIDFIDPRLKDFLEQFSELRFSKSIRQEDKPQRILDRIRDQWKAQKPIPDRTVHRLFDLLEAGARQERVIALQLALQYVGISSRFETAEDGSFQVIDTESETTIINSREFLISTPPAAGAGETANKPILQPQMAQIESALKEFCPLFEDPKMSSVLSFLRERIYKKWGQDPKVDSQGKILPSFLRESLEEIKKMITAQAERNDPNARKLLASIEEAEAADRATMIRDMKITPLSVMVELRERFVFLKSETAAKVLSIMAEEIYQNWVNKGQPEGADAGLIPEDFINDYVYRSASEIVRKRLAPSDMGPREIRGNMSGLRTAISIANLEHPAA